MKITRFKSFVRASMFLVTAWALGLRQQIMIKLQQGPRCREQATQDLRRLHQDGSAR
jgi:hypothetical protein